MADNGNLPRGATEAADWAARNGGAYPGLCDHFVGLAFGLPHSGYESAAKHWEQTPGNLKHPGDSNPPVGSLVYFDTGKQYGHVAIVSGYDKGGSPLITTTHTNGGTPTVMSLDNSGLSYLGWATPYFGGKSAPVDESTVGVTRSAGGVTKGDNPYPNDQSGVAVTPVTPDKLNKRELAAEYGYAWSIIKAVPELKKLFLEAFNNKDGQWTEKKFGIAIKDTKWYHKNAEFTRDAMVARAAGGADWKADREEAMQAIDTAAVGAGVQLTPQQRADLTHRYLFEGWGLPERQALMNEEIGSMVGGTPDQPLQGDAGDLAETLKQTATANGLTYDDAYYANAAREVAMGRTTAEDADRKVRQDAASYWPTYSDQILAGADARQLASHYINTMAKVMEKDPYSIDLNNQDLRKAMTGVDEKGNFKPMGLWEFEMSLRKKPEWMDTKNGQDEVSNVGVGILKRMGFMT